MFNILTLAFLNLIVSIRADRILFVMPHPAISHQIAARSLINNLIQRSEVVVITPHPAYPSDEAPANLTEVDVSDTIGGCNDPLNLGTGRRKDSFYNGYLVHAKALNSFFKQLKKPEVQKVFDQKFDLVVAEALFRPSVALARRCHAPLVHFSTLGTLFPTDFEGSLTHYLYYPNNLRMRVHNLSAWEKLTELYNDIYYQIGFELTVRSHERRIEDLFPFGVDQKTLRKDVEMTLLNSNLFWDGNRPKPLNVVYVGGIHNPRQKELPQQLKSFLDSSLHGVIYVSFGTSVVVSQLPRDKIIAMGNVLSRLPYDVLWKWDGDLPVASGNIRVSKWLPQAGVLRHPKIRLFITQAGIHSTEEAINAGVPLLGVPLGGDQWYNAEKYAHFKIGERIELMDLTEERFKSSVETVINDEMYRHNVVRLRTLIADQPLAPAQRVAWAVMRARRRAGAVLRSPSAHLTPAQYYELELLLIALLAVVLIAALTCYAIRRILALVLRATNISW